MGNDFYFLLLVDSVKNNEVKPYITFLVQGEGTIWGCPDLPFNLVVGSPYSRLTRPP